MQLPNEELRELKTKVEEQLQVVRCKIAVTVEVIYCLCTVLVRFRRIYASIGCEKIGRGGCIVIRTTRCGSGLAGAWLKERLESDKTMLRFASLVYVK